MCISHLGSLWCHFPGGDWTSSTKTHPMVHWCCDLEVSRCSQVFQFIRRWTKSKPLIPCLSQIELMDKTKRQNSSQHISRMMSCTTVSWRRSWSEHLEGLPPRLRDKWLTFSTSRQVVDGWILKAKKSCHHWGTKPNPTTHEGLLSLSHISKIFKTRRNSVPLYHQGYLSPYHVETCDCHNTFELKDLYYPALTVAQTKQTWFRNPADFVSESKYFVTSQLVNTSGSLHISLVLVLTSLNT